MKPNSLNMTKAEQAIFQKLEDIGQQLQLKKEMFNALRVCDIVKDLRVDAAFVIREWIETGLLPAINLGGSDRKRGGWRIKFDDYTAFLKTLNTNKKPHEELRAVYMETPEQLIRNFQIEHGLIKKEKAA